ncbi:hypothetical protein AGMMS49965_13330 [Bacteroidia bacterium]|nr:hypothetical protein AGMMS49965_13330 [Bacteroidia bacterium]
MKTTKEKIIPPPTEAQVEQYLKKWTELHNYVLQESSLKKLFHETYPNNNEMDDVLIKVCALNDFYGTHILSPFNVAKRIVELNIDERLAKGDMVLVNEIAANEINGKKKNFYSFASKYCSHHKPQDYPIYDFFVKEVLLHFLKEDKFYSFKKEDLKNYPVFKEILLQFRKFYHLEEYDLKKLDKYLWLFGKEYFPRKYNEVII